MPRDTQATRDAIIKAAQGAGENPAYALAVAERESNFDPAARSSKTIRGIYQMRGDLRAKYGSGDSADPGAQAQGWMKSLPDIRSDMQSVLGRAPSDPEAYLGHHFGARRAARTLKMDPSTPVEAIFTPQEMGANPHFARAGTIGNLNSSVMADIGKRTARFGGTAVSPPAAEPSDLSSFGSTVLDASSTDARGKRRASDELDTAALERSPPIAPDLSSFGDAVEQPQPSAQAAPQAPPDLSSFGTPV